MAEHTNGPEEHGNNPAHPGVAHERRDINVFQVTAFGIGLLLSCIVVVFAMWAMFDFFYAREDAKNASNPSALMINERQKLPPAPRTR